MRKRVSAGARLAVVLAPLLAEHAADLADRAVRAQRVAQRRQHVRGSARGLAHRGERGVGLAGVAPGAHARGALDLAPLGLRVDRCSSIRRRPIRSTYALTPTIDALARLDVAAASGTPPSRSRPARSPASIAGDGAAELVDPLDQLPGARLELVGQRLDVVRAAERIGRRGRAALVARGSAACAARSSPRARVGSASASSNEFVCSDCAPPQTAESAWIATRTMLFSGCCAVSVEPPVCAWKRSASAFGFVAPNRSRMMRAHSRRAARNFATSWKKSLCALKKNDSRCAELVGREPGRRPRPRSRRSRWRA